MKPDAGGEMHDLIADLYPICRSITGDGNRRTLRRLGREVELKIFEVATGTQVFDWTVPKEWNIRDAYIQDSDGRRIVDFQKSNLHVVGYSHPVRARMSLKELKPHLYSLPDRPDWIPYRTSFYTEQWGFCLPHRQYLALADGLYDVCIDSSLTDGFLTYGEVVLSGETDREVLISAHICHPSLCNDNLSGIVVATMLAKSLAEQRRRYTYRFLFAPATIGAITWLAGNAAGAQRIAHGLVLASLGDGAGFTYKRSRRGNSEIDRVVEHALKMSSATHRIEDFTPYGYDERQFCSPGFNLAVGCISRSMYGRIPEYHTSADNLDFVKPEQLAGALDLCREVVSILESNRTYCNRRPYAEPRLDKHGLYRSSGGNFEQEDRARLWVLNFSDGSHSVLDIAERSGLPFRIISGAADSLRDCGLLDELSG